MSERDDPFLRPALRLTSSRATEKCPLADTIRAAAAFGRRVAARLLTADEFIERHGSGTLRKNRRQGMDWAGQYLHERTAYEFGWCFESVHETRVTWGTPITQGDCRAVTEAGWFIDRYVHVCAFPGDELETKYIMIEYPDGTRKEGLGMVVRATSAAFVPERHMVFAVIAEWDAAGKRFKDATNPC
jgi:hypothetical protein